MYRPNIQSFVTAWLSLGLRVGGMIGSLWWVYMAVRLIYAWWWRWGLVIAELAALRTEILTNCDLPDIRMTSGMREHCATWSERRAFLLEEDPAWRAWGMAMRDVNICGSDGCIKELGDQALNFMSWMVWAALAMLMIFAMMTYFGHVMHQKSVLREGDAYILPGADVSHSGCDTNVRRRQAPLQIQN